MAVTHVVQKGYGYWDVTQYPYGGCFRRATAPFAVTMVGPGGKYPKRESVVVCPGDGGERRLVVTNDALVAVVPGLGDR